MSTPTAAAPTTTTRPGLVLTVVCLCQLMVVLDITVVNVALPSIRDDLGFRPADLPWVVNAYTLTFGGLLLLGGRVADLFGQRTAAIAGLSVFGLTSLVGGLASEPGQLIAARALQGVSGALLLPVSLTVITTSFAEGPDRRRALGIWAAVMGVGGAAGVLLGGALTEWLDWRWVFFVNVPIALVAIPLALASIRNLHRGSPRLDLAGAVLVTGATTCLVYAVVRTDRHAWDSAHTLGLLGLALVLGALFLLVEARFAGEPLVRLGLLRQRSLAVASVLVFFIALGQFGAFYLASLYLQNVLHYSPLEAGLAFVPFSLGTVAGTVVGMRLVAARGPWLPVVLGLGLTAAGIGWFGAISPDGSFVADMLGPSMVASVGLGACLVANTSLGTTGVDPSEAGLASGILNAARQIGGSIGLAALVAVAGSVTRHHDGPPLAALNAGYARGFLVAGCLVAVATVVCLVAAPRDRAEGIT
ncbi:MFS transporter [Nocardioides sp. LHD-245]|uniref:MFS transporter n=1 Tax=Nocardioides sp. LHD-245 TaxID=3051387 RepID=UPI0027DF67D4|nr:MFS transporter [Nocardioides sp. LHD-245]